MLARQVYQGDAALAPRFVAALTRLRGEPEQRLRELLRKTNERCNYDESGVLRGNTIGQPRYRTIDWKAAKKVLARVLIRALDWRAAWDSGPTSGMDRFEGSRDTCLLLAVRDDLAGLVTVGVGVSDVFSPKPREAWPSIQPGAEDAPERFRAWARDFEAEDRVVFTVEQVQEVARGARPRAGDVRAVRRAHRGRA